MSADPKKVFIIHGRNINAKNAVEQFVRSLKLDPIDFDELAGDMGAAFVGEIVREGMARARGIIGLFTADEIAFLRPDLQGSKDSDEEKARWQARPNVIFEAGMAYGFAPERTILTVLGGETKLFSDVRGVHLTFLNNSPDARKRLRQKLIGAGCHVDQRSDAWLDPKRSGDFDSCVLPEVSTTPPFQDGLNELDLEAAVVDAVRRGQRDSGEFTTTARALHAALLAKHPKMTADVGDIEVLVRHMAAEGKLRIVYAEGNGHLCLRA